MACFVTSPALAVTKIGTSGPDTLRGTNGADNLIGKGGNDRIFSLAGKDNLLGGPGRDFMLGGTPRLASGGDKSMVGGPGNDAVGGGLGSDNVVGQEGNDLLVGGPGLVPREASNDKLFGGDGNDVFDVLNKPAGRDVVICGSGFDRVLADRKDVVAPDCEKVFVGLGSFEKWQESIPQSFWGGLPLLRLRLDAMGAGASATKSVGGLGAALFKGVGDVARTDKPTKNARDGFMTEHMEIAAYELLERLAKRAGDEQTAEVARLNRADEQAMAKKIDSNWDKFLDLTLATPGLLG